MIRITCLRKCNRSKLKCISNAKLRNSHTIFISHRLNFRLIKNLAMCNRRIRFYCYTILLTVLYKFHRCITDMQKNLIYHWLNFSGLKKAFNISYLEI